MSGAANDQAEAPVQTPRFSRGKRPMFYETPGMDEAMSMILVLANELSVARDRLDTLERLMAANKVLSSEEVEDFEPDAEALEAREQRRQNLLERLYFLPLKQANELASAQTGENYQRTLDEIAKG